MGLFFFVEECFSSWGGVVFLRGGLFFLRGGGFLRGVLFGGVFKWDESAPTKGARRVVFLRGGIRLLSMQPLVIKPESIKHVYMATGVTK